MTNRIAQAWGPMGAIAAALSLVASTSALAVEGGSGAYLLGSRDIYAGLVPPPGYYVSSDTVYIDGHVDGLSVGGAVATDVGLTALVEKLSATYSSQTKILHGRFAFSVQLPIASVSADFDLISPVTGVGLSDKQAGLGDLILVPMLGYDSGNLHANISVPIYIPTGQYSEATANLGPPVDVDILSISKNRLGMDPTLGLTYLNPSNGIELTAALGVTLSMENSATDYQTAPELHFEATAAQHFANGFVVAATGYAYQQLWNDSGEGAENLQNALDAESLQARVFGAGPLIGYSTKIGESSLSMKLKYIYEFGAKRRLESNVIWGNLSISF